MYPLSSDAAFLNVVKAFRDQHFWLLLARKGPKPEVPSSSQCQTNSVRFENLAPLQTSLAQATHSHTSEFLLPLIRFTSTYAKVIQKKIKSR